MRSQQFLSIFIWLGCIALALPGKAQGDNGTSVPNIIVILADDLGYQDVGFNGCADIPTPNIDRIAREGVRFTNGYVTYAVCGPSRAGTHDGPVPGQVRIWQEPPAGTK